MLITQWLGKTENRAECPPVILVCVCGGGVREWEKKRKEREEGERERLDQQRGWRN